MSVISVDHWQVRCVSDVLYAAVAGAADGIRAEAEGSGGGKRGGRAARSRTTGAAGAALKGLRATHGK